MAAIEIILLVSTTLLVLAAFVPSVNRRRFALTTIAVISVCIATILSIQGLRWQLLPVFSATALLCFFSPAHSHLTHEQSRFSRIAGALTTTLGLFLICVGAVALWAFPALSLPAPTGAFAVGTTTVDWEDRLRQETSSSGFRKVVVQFWYPANAISGDTAVYLGRNTNEAALVASAIGNMYGVPAFLLSEAARGRSHSIVDAAAATGTERFPVILFSPGLGGVRMQNTAWAEELASHGYIVAGLDHPYDSAAVVFNDGTMISSQLESTGNDEEDRYRAAEWTSLRAADMRFVLDQLERIDSGKLTSQLAGRFDLTRVAATGHSLGGAAAIQAGTQDARFDAIINIDGFPRFIPVEPYPQPVLVLMAGMGTGNDENDREYADRVKTVLDLSQSAAYRLTVPGVGHMSFTDAALFLPPIPALFGSLDRVTGISVTADSTLVFLQEALFDAVLDTEARLQNLGQLDIR